MSLRNLARETGDTIQTIAGVPELIRALEEHAEALRLLDAHTTSGMAEKRAFGVNGILLSRIVQLDANGSWSESQPTNYEAITVIDAMSAGAFVVANDNTLEVPQSTTSANAVGRGRQLALAGTKTDVHVTGRSLTIASLQGTGAANKLVGIVIWSRFTGGGP